MDERDAIKLIHRRAGWGLRAGELDAAADRGLDAEIERLVDPTAAGVDPEADVWDDDELVVDPRDAPAAAEARRAAIAGWLERMARTDRPGEHRRAWLLHGWLVSSLAVVQAPALMADQIRRFLSRGGESYPGLLREITTDAAMLRYLDGDGSTADSPNENYGRELLELFALGVGQYTEDDVRAAAAALTGWTVRRRTGEVRWVPQQHDDTPRRFLGTDGVHDVDTVIDAIVAHPAHDAFVARRIATELLGTTDAQAVDDLTDAYATNDRRLAAVVERALRRLADGAAAPVILAPIPWLMVAIRAVGAAPWGRGAIDDLRATGQVPLLPPNVGGWPGGTAWLASGGLVARIRLAERIAGSAPERSPALVAADEADPDALADVLGVVSANGSTTFGADTRAALNSAADPRVRLTLALTSPEFLQS